MRSFETHFVENNFHNCRNADYFLALHTEDVAADSTVAAAD